MKKLFSILAVICLIWSCAPVKTTISGLENVAYLEIYGTKSNYPDMVQVVVDDSPVFSAEVNSKTSNKIRTKRYEIPTGKHEIIISYKNTEISRQTVFTSSQITKKITLP